MPPPVYLLLLRALAVPLLALGVSSAWRAKGSAPASVGVLLFPLAAGGWRTAQVGHLPLAGLHETLLTFGICLALVSTVLCLPTRAWRVHGLGLAGAGALMILSSLVPARPTPLVPALQTPWFEAHVASSFAAYACFAVSGAAGAVLLAKGATGSERKILQAANRWGFAWFTWAMVSGGIWAYLAWGTYWLWHVKELWSGILWTYYAGAVHLPHTQAWRWRGQAVASVVGFGLVLATYLGVGLLMRNTHQF